MTYVEEMELKIWDARDRSGCAEIINRIIADTKRADKYAYLQWYGAEDARLGCIDSIDQAEVKGE